MAVALYGLAPALRRPVSGGAWLGIGAAIAFLSKGFQGPAWLALSALALIALGSAWRRRQYAVTLLTAALVAVSLCVPWIYALYLRDPALLTGWLATEAPGQWIAFVGDAGNA